VTSLAKWEDAKKRDGDELLERLHRDPNDRDAILRAIQFSLAYQDEPLFDNVVEALAGERTGDAAIQASSATRMAISPLAQRRSGVSCRADGPG